MAELGFLARFFEKHARDGVLDMNAVTDQALERMRQAVIKGDLPKGIITTDSRRALNILNRLELEQAFIAHRRRVDGIALRGYVPLSVSDPTVVHQWVRSADDRATAEQHARERFASSIATGVLLHGAALVQMGWTPRQVREAAHAEVDRVCDRLEAPAAEQAA